MNLSQQIQDEDYWERRLHDQWRQYRAARDRRGKVYHRNYCRELARRLRRARRVLAQHQKGVSQ